MSLELLMEQFDITVRTPADVEKLNQAILQWAVMGKLVPQEPNDEPASVSLERIAAEKARLVEERKIRKPPEYEIVPFESMPYERPIGWQWIRLGEQLLEDHGGKTPSKRNPLYWDGDVPWASVKDLNSDKFLVETQDKITELALKETGVPLVPKGNVIVCVRMGLGKILINQVDVAINQDLRALYLSDEIDANYFIIAYRTLRLTGSGMTVKGIRRKDLLNLPFPLPPLAEQKRIVAKVEELFGQTRALKERLETAERQRRRFHTAGLHRLTSAQTPQETGEAWRLIGENLGRLYTEPETIDELKQAILQLAVMGRLVPQDPNDEPASVLLERISDRNKQLREEKQLRKTKPFPEVGQDEELHPLPTSWQWVRMDHLCYQITDGVHHTPTYVDKGVPFLSVKDISGGVIDLSDTKFITREAHEQLIRRCQPEFGDILLTKVGTTGIAKVVDIHQEFSIFVSVALLKFPQDLLNSHYLEHLINSPLVKQQSDRFTMGVGNQNLVLKHIKNFVVPLPAANEQERIVAKIDELFALCDRLAAQAAGAEATREKLLDAVLAGA